MAKPTSRHTRVIKKYEPPSTKKSTLQFAVLATIPLVLFLLGAALLIWPMFEHEGPPYREATIETPEQPKLSRIEDISTNRRAKTEPFKRVQKQLELDPQAAKEIDNEAKNEPLDGPLIDRPIEDHEDALDRTGDQNQKIPTDQKQLPEGPWPRSALSALPSVKPPTPWKKLDLTKPLTRIAVGSCLSQTHPQPIWNDVLALKPLPDLFLMIGDNVYGDIKSPDYRELIRAYRLQGRHHDFAKARSRLPFLATWDDHDYGANDAGASFPHSRASAILFSDYWQIDTGRPPESGIFYSKMIGPPGKRVHIIMLDLRSHRSAFTRKTRTLPYWGPYQPDMDQTRTMLGEQQWAWLQDEMKRPADFRIIVSSIQVLAGGHGFERWGNLPREQHRLLNVLAQSSGTPTLLLSGDRHVGAFYKVPLTNSRTLLEITTSSMNRPYGPSKDLPTPSLASAFYHRENFALIDIDWPNAQVELSLRGLRGEIFHVIKTAFSELGAPRRNSTYDAR